jgi:hypothetical protein
MCCRVQDIAPVSSCAVIRCLFTDSVGAHSVCVWFVLMQCDSKISLGVQCIHFDWLHWTVNLAVLVFGHPISIDM